MWDNLLCRQYPSTNFILVLGEVNTTKMLGYLKVDAHLKSSLSVVLG